MQFHGRSSLLCDILVMNMKCAFAYHFVVHRILHIVMSIIALYYFLELTITGCLGIIVHYYGSTFDMNTGCPLSDVSCTNGKPNFYPGMGYWMLRFKGLILVSIDPPW